MPLKCAIYLMALIVLFLLAGVIPGRDGVPTGVFHSPVFIFLGVLMVIGVVAASIRRQWTSAQIPFWMAHAGIALVLAGAAIDHFWGVSHQLVIPLHEPSSRQFQSMDKTASRSMGMGTGMTEMPFMMRLDQLEIFSYDPKRYRIYRPGPTSDGRVEFKPAGEVAPYLETVKDPNDKPVQIWFISLAKIPGLDKEWAGEKIPVGQLVPGKGSRLRRMVPLGELSLECEMPPDKTIDVKIEFGEGEKKENIYLTVNHPAVYQGWRFYMMSYDTEQFQWAMVTARHDPGRGTVIAGLWLVILGMAGLCFWKRRSPEPPSAIPSPPGSDSLDQKTQMPAELSGTPREGGN